MNKFTETKTEMSNQDFRLFINNITGNINEDSLHKKLSQFGDISSIEIKLRKNIIGNQTPAFAYININSTPENIQKCFEDFSRQKFENSFIDISIAKESFMERLKHEREKKHNGNDQKTKSETETLQNETSLVPFKIPKACSVIKCISEKNNVNSHLNLSEQKRLHSVLQKKKEYHSQKLLLQNALSRIDLNPRSNVIFYEKEDCMASNKGNANEWEKKQKDKFQLFTENDDNETNSEWFEVKEHFEGIKGQKLLKLQSRYKNDPRFSMDTRFLENDISEARNFDEEESKKDISVIENDAEKERMVQMQILEQVLSKEIAPSTYASSSEGKILSGMFRYDPDHKDHLKYEITPVTEKYGRDKKKVDIETENFTEIEYKEKPQVSKEKFYKVTANLKEALFTGQQFSILNTFGDHYENRKDYNEQNAASVSKKKNKKEGMIISNLFAYDSSTDSEDEKKNENIFTEDTGSFKSQKLWAKSFFFQTDDYRLQDGLHFVKRLDVNDATDFVKSRRKIKEAVKAKMKNNQKKFSPFKKKLGETKRVKIKRALKK
ncbi:nucleolar protein 8 isoform X2 [Agrilus planipennis]|uniref:Nucleolar protein 8 isoform X2 n=1 Tax=Agrilus planipennis TaxID=224129 RepID=A0A1W4XE70_AGRPL|nr:nucleolar protein 8 isoform X2 [Agrilus planipennis]